MGLVSAVGADPKVVTVDNTVKRYFSEAQLADPTERREQLR